MNKSIQARIASLSPQKRKLFEQRLKLQGVNFDSGPGPTDQVRHSIDDFPFDDTAAKGKTALDFSLFFFSHDGDSKQSGKYDHLIECAKFADQNGFSAVWTPERHYKSFGGLYPNPSVLGAALSMVTEQVAIRAGSVVLPLHHPQRVAEEWAVVDNLSAGRAGIAIASGWNPDDFASMPECFENRKETMFSHLKTLIGLWHGESFSHPHNNGAEANLKTYPRPLQTELPIWLTSLSDESFITAGKMGLHVLTGMMDHDVEECGRKIALYRQALAEHGHDPEQGKVSVMLHTYIGEDREQVKALVKTPMLQYLEAFVKASEAKLIADPNFEQAYRMQHEGDRAALANFAFDKFFDTRSLFGTRDSCGRMLQNLAKIGVDEVACLLDFGLSSEEIWSGMNKLRELREAYGREVN